MLAREAAAHAREAAVATPQAVPTTCDVTTGSPVGLVAAAAAALCAALGLRRRAER